MKCTVCSGKGKLRNGKNCLLCDGSGQREPTVTGKPTVEDKSFLGTIVGVVVGVIIGVLIGGTALQGMISAETDGQKGIFLLTAIFSFILAGLFGGAASAAISKDNRSILDHMSLPATAAFVANFAACAYGVNSSF